MDEMLQIVPTPQERQRAVLEFLFTSMPANERVAQMATTLAGVRQGRLSLGGLLEARRGDELAGCIWASAMGGRAALIWPPQIAAGEDDSTAARLLDAVDVWMQRENLSLANAFVADSQSSDARRLLAGGYVLAAEILYLVSERAAAPGEQPGTLLEFEPFSEDKETRLTDLIEQTYQGTLDCPLLNGQREMSDVLAGYRQTGNYDPTRWFFVRCGGADVGCLLLADHPDEDQWELVYQGVLPSARGHGFGLAMTRYAQWLAACAERSRLVLAVDAENRPAIAMYTAAGFHQWDRRFVYVKFIDDSGPQRPAKR